MDIENREKALLQKNASISANSSPKIEPKLPRRVSIESRNRHPSDSSSISSINTAVSTKDHGKDPSCGMGTGSNGAGAGGATTKAKRTLKKVNLAVVKQRKKDMGNLELLKTLDEYVSGHIQNSFT